MIGADLEYEYIHAPLHVDQTISVIRCMNTAGEVIDPRPKVIGEVKLNAYLVTIRE